MRVRMLFSPEEDGRMPCLLDAVDEYTEDEWGRTPDFYAEKLKRYPEAREIIVVVPDHAVLDLFKPPTVTAHIDGSRCAPTDGIDK